LQGGEQNCKEQLHWGGGGGWGGKKKKKNTLDSTPRPQKGVWKNETDQVIGGGVTQPLKPGSTKGRYEEKEGHGKAGGRH